MSKIILPSPDMFGTIRTVEEVPMTTEQDQEWQRYIDAWYTMYLRQKQVMHEMMQEMAEGASHDPR